MATADRPRRFASTAALLLVVPVAAALWFGANVMSSGHAAPTAASASEPEPLAVAATGGPHFSTLADLVAGSDLIVTGRVESTERGRLVGDPNGGGVVSRFVTVRIDEVLKGAPGERLANVLVEEEGWLPDGAAIAVNGLAPSAEEDAGVWFLDRIDTGDGPTYVVVNEQGRYLDRAGGTVGADTTDALVANIEQRPLTETVAAVRKLGEK
jgi:hypothetical protein